MQSKIGWQSSSTRVRNRTQRLTAIAIFVALITVGAFIKVPIGIIPVSMQFCFCLLSGLILGWKDACISVLIYLALGLAGVPIFTAGGGITYVLQPTFGYMLGFVIAVVVCGLISRGRANVAPKLWHALIGAFAALAIVYTIGVFYMYAILKLYIGSAITLSGAWLTGCALFLPTDGMWCVICSLVAVKVVPVFFRSNIGRGKLKYGVYEQEYIRMTYEINSED